MSGDIKEARGHVDNQGKSVPGRGKRKCKGLEAGPCSAGWSNSQEAKMTRME